MADIAEQIALGDLSMELDTAGQPKGLFAAMLRMVTTLKDKARLADIVASGDFTSEVELNSDKDLLGQSLQTMSTTLNQVIGDVNESTEQIASGSGQVADASQSLSQGAAEQAASLEQITSSMTEMASQTKTNAENAG